MIKNTAFLVFNCVVSILIICRFKKVTAPSLLRQKPDSGFNKNLKMAKMSPATDNTYRKTLSVEGKKRPAFEKSASKGLAARTADRTEAIAASNAKTAMTQDTPDFTVLDVKQEEFEQVCLKSKHWIIGQRRQCPNLVHCKSVQCSIVQCTAVYTVLKCNAGFCIFIPIFLFR